MADEDGVIKEGFLCPICHTDLRSPKILLAHFQEQHSEEQDLLKSLKDLVGRAKSKILKLDEKDIEDFKSELTFHKGGLEKSVPQEAGQTHSHINYFKEVRRERLDHRTSETNKLIIRLDRFLRAEGTDRKQIAQELVTWLDGSTVSRCPSCAASFNITRRQHHCRLCGSIMCNACSSFLTYEDARTIITPVPVEASKLHKDDSETLRICLHCKDMLACRKEVQLNQNIQLPITKYYERLQRLKNEIEVNVHMYHKMYSSLTTGDSSYQLQDMQSLKGSIAKQAELLDVISKRISELPQDPLYPKALNLQISIRRGTSSYIKEHLLSLPVLPSPAQLEKLRQARIQRNTEVAHSSPSVQVKKLTVATGWSPANMGGKNVPELTDDPLIDQMNIVRSYIDQAKAAQRYEEVASLRENLRMLKEMHRTRMITNLENN